MGLGRKQALFLQGANSLSADLEANFATINNNSLGLEVWLPDFRGVALRETNVVSVLLAFAGNFTFLHNSGNSTSLTP